MNIFKRILIFLLILEARLILWRYRPKIIAVTGSIGKTTTKDAIYAALHTSLHIRKSAKTFNTDIGVPLTILGCDNPWSNPYRWLIVFYKGLVQIIHAHKYPEWLVLEVGADRPGDISKIARWLQPNIAVLTGVPDMPVHVEYFASVEEVVREKRSLADHLAPGGTVVINADDIRMRALVDEFRTVVTYGYEIADVTVRKEEVMYRDGAALGVRADMALGESDVVAILEGALGRPRVYAALAACAVARAVGVAHEDVSKGLSSWEPTPGRMRLLAGVNDSILIDDSYNSSPTAALAALDALGDLRCSGRKIAILGDMMELGKFSNEAHQIVGERAAQVLTMLMTVGIRSRTTAEAALDAGLRDVEVRQYEPDESDRAGKELAQEVLPGDIILIKGSQSMRMERAVYILLKYPERAGELLVRQDPEWLAKK